MPICQTFKCITCGKTIVQGDVVIEGMGILEKCPTTKKRHLVIPWFWPR